MHSACVLRMSDEKTMQLLDLYREEQCLWDTHDEYYRDQMHRRQAAEKIACLLDIPNFGPRHVLMKFKNLRNAYSQELKKIARHEAAGTVYKPTVFWYKKMDAFIKPHLQKPRGLHSRSKSLVCQVDGNEEWLQDNPTIPEFVLKTEIVDPPSDNDSCDSQRKRKLKTTPNWPNKLQRTQRSESEDPNFIEISIPQSTETNKNVNNIGSNNRDQSMKEYIDNQQNSMASVFQALSSSIQALSSQGDVYESFGKYVAQLLRTLPPNKALEVQPLIIDLIAQVGNPGAKSSDKKKSDKC